MENKQKDKVIGMTALFILCTVVFMVCKIGNKVMEKPKSPSISDIIDSGNARYQRETARQEIERKAAIEAEERRPKTKEEIRLYKTISKYQCTPQQAKNILNHKVSMGMSKEMVIAAAGRPNKIHTTRNGNFVQEQWVYGEFPDCSYLYFGNEGTLTGSQTSE